MALQEALIDKPATEGATALRDAVRKISTCELSAQVAEIDKGLYPADTMRAFGKAGAWSTHLAPDGKADLREAIANMAIISQTLKQQRCCYSGEYGASGRIRTSDRSVRSRVLYPAELRMQMAVRRGFEPRMQLLTAYSLSRGAPSASRPPHHTRLFRVLRRTCFCSSSLRWRTYYFLVLISQTLFRDLFSFAHFARNSRAKTAKRAIYQQEISPDAGIMSNNQSGKG